MLWQGYEQRLKTVEDTLAKFKDFEGTSAQVTHQLISSRADMKRLQGRSTKAAEDVSGLKSELSKLRKWHTYKYAYFNIENFGCK